LLPEDVTPRSGLSPDSLLPTPDNVGRPLKNRKRTPCVDYVAPMRDLTNFMHDGSDENSRQSFSASPAFDGRKRCDREHSLDRI